MLYRFKHVFAICLLAIASMQSVQAGIAYEDGGVASPIATLSVFESFEVEAGVDYFASFSDIFDNFTSSTIVVLDNDFNEVGSAMSLVAGDGGEATSIGFEFQALADALYYVILGGESPSLSVYAARIETVGVGGSPVPVPAAVWFMGSAVFALVGFGRRKAA